MLINTKILKAVLLAAGKRDIRYCLNGVHVNERHIVATDGARLHAYAHGQEWTHGPVTIPREAIEMALKVRTVEIEVTATQAGVVAYTPVGGTYPDYMRVIPAQSEIVSGERINDVNPDFAADAIAALELVFGKKRTYALASVGNCYTWKNTTFAVVVMPLRVSGTIDGKAWSATSMEQFK